MDHSDARLKAMDLEEIVSFPRSVLERRMKPQPEQALKCPRCDSTNTKFCYYNNYSLSQPRYFCKACRRYWTKGGSLRNVPVGGGCRKNKRPTPKKHQDSFEPISVPSLLPLTYDPLFETTHMLPKISWPSLLQTMASSLSSIQSGVAFLEWSPTCPYTAFHLVSIILAQHLAMGILKELTVEAMGADGHACDGEFGGFREDPSKSREGEGKVFVGQWHHNNGGNGVFEEGKDYWGAIGAAWNGMVNNCGPSSLSPFI